MLALYLLLACSPGPDSEKTHPEDRLDASTPGLGTGGDGSGGSAREQLIEHGVQHCAAPEERTTLGPMHRPGLGADWAIQRPASLPPTELPHPAGGIVVADLDGDSHLDVFLPNFSACMLFLGQADGSLRDDSEARIPEATGSCNAWGASAVDVDGDGDLDLFLTGESDSDALWENDGTGHFTDVTERAGLGSGICGSRTGSWADMDADGDLDLFVARHRVVEWDTSTEPDPCAGTSDRPPAGNPNSLYENLGDGTFADVSARLEGPLDTGHSFIAGWQDADADGDPDIYIVNDFGSWSKPTNLWWNDGTGHFSPADSATGAELSICGMGVAVGDLNDDAVPDFAIADLGRLHLMLSLGEPAWYDAATSSGLEPDRDRSQLAAWGIAFADMDHDMVLDLAITYGPTEEVLEHSEPSADALYQPDALFLGTADGRFRDVAPSWGLDQEIRGRGLVVVDMNGDGWLDLVRRDYRKGVARIDLARCDGSAWLMVDMDGPLDGFGARVEVDVAGQTLRRWNNPTSTSLASSGPSEVHFGLGSHDRVDELRVYWADGRVSRFDGVDTRQRVTVLAP